MFGIATHSINDAGAHVGYTRLRVCLEINEAHQILYGYGFPASQRRELAQRFCEAFHEEVKVM